MNGRGSKLTLDHAGGRKVPEKIPDSFPTRSHAYARGSIAWAQGGASMAAGMPALTRRRSKDAREECWHVYFGDVRVGTIAMRSGNPVDTDPWAWSCGFCPGSHPREYTSGTAATFDQARTAFEAAWRVFLSHRTEADFQEWREQRDWTARKYAMWEAGERLASQWPTRIMRSPVASRSTATGSMRA
jgi:hypothetical protein